MLDAALRYSRLVVFRYPAGHVWIYTALYRLTDSGRDIKTAQIVFAAIYVATLAVVFRLYRYNAWVRYMTPGGVKHRH